MRGEKSSGGGLRWSILGSPPLARGKVCSRSDSSVPTGITPACAGKRSLSYGKDSLAWDHPRLRGEKSDCDRTSSRHGGSPPLARGKVFVVILILYSVRITPACAGKSWTLRCSKAFIRDHPRLRGEKHTP